MPTDVSFHGILSDLEVTTASTGCYKEVSREPHIHRPFLPRSASIIPQHLSSNSYLLISPINTLVLVIYGTILHINPLVSIILYRNLWHPISSILLLNLMILTIFISLFSANFLKKSLFLFYNFYIKYFLFFIDKKYING